MLMRVNRINMLSVAACQCSSFAPKRSCLRATKKSGAMFVCSHPVYEKHAIGAGVSTEALPASGSATRRNRRAPGIGSYSDNVALHGSECRLGSVGSLISQPLAPESRSLFGNTFGDAEKGPIDRLEQPPLLDSSPLLAWSRRSVKTVSPGRRRAANFRRLIATRIRVTIRWEDHREPG